MNRGTSQAISPMSAARLATFWAHVEKTDGCWKWSGATNGAGYGTFGVSGAMRLAHRIAYTVLVGPIPAGLTLDHLCRNRGCVRPEHLEAVTMRENILRGTAPSASFAQSTSCAAGHPFDGVNTRVTRAGVRQCRACDRDRHRRAYSAAKEKAA